jgi:general nucleoside transport system ATP-binding protein
MQPVNGKDNNTLTQDALESVALRNVSMVYPGGIQAVQDVSIDGRAGEVHAILGENGAGKTTLMRMLAGLIRPSRGEITINGNPCRLASPLDAKRHSIGMVHQHFSLVPALTVAENLALSSRQGGFLFSPAKWRRRLRDSAERFGMDIRPDAPVWRLSVGEQQRVEIFRLLLEGARILILDEPTSILSPRDADILFEHVRRFSQAGHITFLVTHKLYQARAIADRISVLRRGSLVATCPTSHVTEADLARLMVGANSTNAVNGQARRRAPSDGPAVVLAERLTVSPIKCIDGLKDMSFSIRSGEILGIAGISGNGQDELVAALCGIAPFAGRIRIGHNSKAEGNGASLAYIPADRQGVGVATALSLQDNLALRRFKEWPLSAFGIIRARAVRDYADNRIAEYDIRPAQAAMQAGSLSGGNMQKAVLARELDGPRTLVVAVNPTSGLDLATVALVHSKLVEKADQGSAVLLVSEDLDELLALCDHLLVLRRGQLQRAFPGMEADRIAIGLAMTGEEGSSEVPGPDRAMSPVSPSPSEEPI